MVWGIISWSQSDYLFKVYVCIRKSIAGLAHCSFIQFDDLWNHGVQIFRSDVLSPGPGWRHCQIPGYIQEQRSGQPITLQHPHKPLCEADNVLNIADPGGFSQTLPRMTCSSHMPGQQQLSLVVFMVSTVLAFLVANDTAYIHSRSYCPTLRVAPTQHSRTRSLSTRVWLCCCKVNGPL